MAEANKWDRDSLFRVLGTPMKMCLDPNRNKDHTWIEAETGPDERAHDPGRDGVR